MELFRCLVRPEGASGGYVLMEGVPPISLSIMLVRMGSYVYLEG